MQPERIQLTFKKCEVNMYANNKAIWLCQLLFDVCSKQPQVFIRLIEPLNIKGNYV